MPYNVAHSALSGFATEAAVGPFSAGHAHAFDHWLVLAEKLNDGDAVKVFVQDVAKHLSVGCR